MIWLGSKDEKVFAFDSYADQKAFLGEHVKKCKTNLPQDTLSVSRERYNAADGV